MKKEVADKFGANAAVVVATCMLFLRFLSPGILQPQAYGLTRFALSAETFKALLAISKVFQSIANGVVRANLSNCAQVEALVVAFIQKHIPLVKNFCDAQTSLLDLEAIRSSNAKRSSNRKAATLRQLAQYVENIKRLHKESSRKEPSSSSLSASEVECVSEEFAIDSGASRKDVGRKSVSRSSSSTGLSMEEIFDKESASLLNMAQSKTSFGWEHVATRYGFTMKRMIFQYRFCFLITGSIPSYKTDHIQEFLASRTITDWANIFEGLDVDGSDTSDVQDPTSKYSDLSLRFIFPSPFAPRDFVVRQRLQRDSKTNWLVWLPVRRSGVPPVPGNVRGSLHMLYSFSSSSSQTKIKLLTMLDPKGSMPEWILEHYSLMYFNASFKLSQIIASFTPTITASTPRRPPTLPRNATQWEIGHVQDWVTTLGLPSSTASLFADNEVNGELLLEITDDDLKQMGISKLGERKKLLKNVAIIKQRGYIPMVLSPQQSQGSTELESSSSEEVKSITVRCFYDDEMELVTVPAEISYKVLLRQLEHTYGVALRIRYKDADGDLLNIKSEADWADCLVEAQNRRIKLYLSDASDPKKSLSQSQESIDTPSSVVDFDWYTLFDNILDPVIVINEFGIIHYVNEKTTQLLGYRASDLVGHNVSMIQTPETAPFHDGFLKNYLRSGVSRIIGKGREVQAVKKDGTIISVHLEVSERNIQQSNSTVYIGVLKTITRTQRVEKSMLQQELEVIRGLQEPAIVIDGTGSILAVNTAMEALLGYRFMEMAGKNVTMLMTSDDARNHDSYLAKYKKTGVARIIGKGFKVIVQTQDGTLKTVFLTVSEKKDNGKSFFTGIMQTKTPMMRRKSMIIDS